MSATEQEAKIKDLNAKLAVFENPPKQAATSQPRDEDETESSDDEDDESSGSESEEE